MSIELRDIRAKVGIETDIALEVECLTTGKDKSELVREILQGWAEHRIHAAHLLTRRLKSEGNRGELQGIPGSGGGASGKMRENG